MIEHETCPQCGHDARIVGGFNAIDYLQCDACGYYGDHWEANGIVYDIEVPIKDGMRHVDQETYDKRIAEIEAAYRHALSIVRF
jgi:hypothetical protein